MKKIILTNRQIQQYCAKIAIQLPKHAGFYGVPRGGIAPAYAIAAMSNGYVVDNPANATYIVDDLIDSGATRVKYMTKYPRAKFINLYEKTNKDIWYVFPWELDAQGEDSSAEDIFLRLLQYIGEDPSREGLVDTPKRMVKAWAEITSGYNENPSDYFKTFSENAEDYDQMILLDPIPYYSICEHHLLPFFGSVHIGYIPDKRFAGISKFARVVGTYSKRLQIQERLTEQIAQSISDGVHPLGVAVVVKGEHLCMSMRGVKAPGVVTTTSSMKGVFLNDAKARNEFLQLIK